MADFLLKRSGLLSRGALLCISPTIALNYKYPTLNQIKARFRSSGSLGWLIFALIYLVARLMPVVPFTALNYATGLSPIRIWRYIWATLLGILPGTLSYILSGAYGIHPKSWQFRTGVLLLVTLLFSNQLMKERQ